MGTGAGLASSYFEKWACNTQEPVRLTFPENVATKFLCKMEFTGKIWPPSSTDIHKYFSSAEYSPLNRYRYSNASHCRQEVQSV
jgi:hypothetical protein